MNKLDLTFYSFIMSFSLLIEQSTLLANSFTTNCLDHYKPREFILLSVMN